MEQIEQLKAMRNAAQVRIAATPDYKLLTSLNALIAELEAAFGISPSAAPPAATADRETRPQNDAAPRERTAASGNGGGEVSANGILGNGTKHEAAVRAAVDAEEEALDQAVADLEAELYSAGVTSSTRGPKM